MSDQANRSVSALEREHGSALVNLMSHAALPVVLNPELLHLLRINYFLDPPETLPFAAEGQVLLSPLCNAVDDGLYVIEPDVRDVLLQRLVKQYGGDRLRDVARLLWEYNERTPAWLSRPGLAEAQQLTALNFIDAKQAMSWLERARAGHSAAPAPNERWFLAIQNDLVRNSAAVEQAEQQPVYLSSKIPALAELRDLLVTLDPNDPAMPDVIAQKASLQMPPLKDDLSVAGRWQGVLETAWLMGRMPAIFQGLSEVYPSNPDRASSHGRVLDPALAGPHRRRRQVCRGAAGVGDPRAVSLRDTELSQRRRARVRAGP